MFFSRSSFSFSVDLSCVYCSSFLQCFFNKMRRRGRKAARACQNVILCIHVVVSISASFGVEWHVNVVESGSGRSSRTAHASTS